MRCVFSLLTMLVTDGCALHVFEDRVSAKSSEVCDCFKDGEFLWNFVSV